MRKKPKPENTPKPENETFPMRINKYLSHKNLTTRKEADRLIKAGLVFINGQRVELGAKVMPNDQIEVRHLSKITDNYKYYAYNKPEGVITHSPQGDEVDILKSLAHEKLGKVFPIGRLDKDSHGLMILTNDGRITNKMLNPEEEHEKEYVVKTARPLRNNFKEKMEAGVMIEGYKTRPCKIKILGPKTFSITLTEGKKHQIKRMVVAQFNEVADLMRTRIMNIKLGSLGKNEVRELEGDELKNFLNNLGL